MKKIGIVGGLGPEATVDYYKRITSFFHHYNQSLSTPEIIIYSVDLAELFSMVSEQQWDALVAWLVSKLTALKNSGADFALISANTPHIVFDSVNALSPLPLISIVEVTLDCVKSLGLKNVGLLGTKFTMEANFFGDRFAKEGISVLVPSAQEQAYIQEKLVNEIELGIIQEETRQGLLGIIKNMIERDHIEAVILGCTELPLILSDREFGIPLLNTTALHVESACRYCLGE